MKGLPPSADQLLWIHRKACCFFEAGGVDHMTAQDLATEVCLRWLAQNEQGCLNGCAWLRAVQRNLLTDYFRRRACESRLLESYASALERRDRVPNESACDLVERLNDLSLSDQVTLREHYFEGLPLKELARRFGISIDSAKQRLCRARSRLRRLATPVQNRRSELPARHDAS